MVGGVFRFAERQSADHLRSALVPLRGRISAKYHALLYLSPPAEACWGVHASGVSKLGLQRSRIHC